MDNEKEECVHWSLKFLSISIILVLGAKLIMSPNQDHVKDIPFEVLNYSYIVF